MRAADAFRLAWYRFRRTLRRRWTGYTVGPVLTVIAVLAGALLAANVVAAMPGRVAARTPAAALLRAE
ncbi:MAG TPA: hypothetical protein VMI73_06420 [Trebonia sp.]|nr:hypothetical protein [Trebonia sp.]